MDILEALDYPTNQVPSSVANDEETEIHKNSLTKFEKKTVKNISAA